MVKTARSTCVARASAQLQTPTWWGRAQHALPPALIPMQRLTLCLAFGSAAALTLSPRVAHPRAGRIVATGDVNIKVKRPDAGAIEAKRAEEAAAQLEEVRAGCSSFVPTMAARLAPDVVLPSSADALQAALEGDLSIHVRGALQQVSGLPEWECGLSALANKGTLRPLAVPNRLHVAVRGERRPDHRSG
eukprot:6325351-Prymnesium_polylepis.2